MYKLCPPNPITLVIDSVWKLNADGKAIFGIPFDPDNSDYQKFKVNVINGSELQDENGEVMTPEKAKIYISTLP
jgi:hypothetical protein